MSNEQSGPTGNFVGLVGPKSISTKTLSFQIQVTNAPFFGTGPGTAYVGINSKGWCYLTSDPGQAASFTAAKDGDGRKFISTPDGWLSYQGATPYYLGSWQSITNEYQTWIEGGILHLHGGVMSFYSDGSNTWLYNQSENTVGYTPCTVLPATAP
jgi:hypothetical protein